MELLLNEKIELGDFYLTYYGKVKLCKRIGDQKKGRVEDWNGFTDKNGNQCYTKIKK